MTQANQLKQGDVLAEASLRYKRVQTVHQFNGWVEVAFTSGGSVAFDNDRGVELVEGLVMLNRTCKGCGTDYTDPGGDVEDPDRYCPKCGSRAWYAGPDIAGRS